MVARSSSLFSSTLIVSYVVLYENQAQEYKSVQSVVTTRLKGVNVVDNPESFMTNCPPRPSDQNWAVFDQTDLVVPPQVRKERP